MNWTESGWAFGRFLPRPPRVTPPKEMKPLGLFLVVALTVTGAVRAATPVDPEAIPQVGNLLNWLASLPDRADHKIVSGQYHVDHVAAIQAETGICVGLIGDYFITPRGAWLDDSRAATVREDMLKHWNAGGIVTVHMAFQNPKTKGPNNDNDFTDVDMEAAVTPDGNPINTNLRAWLDRWAIHDQWLADRGVPAIIRPLHEMNCCFWYGRRDPAKTIALWKYIFSYLTRTKRIHNLLFAYSPANFRANFTAYYPGSEWTDLVGFDLYKDLTGGADLTSADFAGYRALEGLGKPIALCEFGPKQASHPSAEPVDYRKLIAAVKTHAPKCVYWFSWSAQWSMRAQDNSGVGELLRDPWVINRKDIPDLKALPRP